MASVIGGVQPRLPWRRARALAQGWGRRGSSSSSRINPSPCNYTRRCCLRRAPRGGSTARRPRHPDQYSSHHSSRNRPRAAPPLGRGASATSRNRRRLFRRRPPRSAGSSGPDGPRASDGQLTRPIGCCQPSSATANFIYFRPPPGPFKAPK
jgi:hypothetical protein